MEMNRRQFVKYSSFASFVFGYSLQAKATKLLLNNSENQSQNQSAVENQNPIQNVLASESSSLDFNGDNINRPHDILWNVDDYIAKQGGRPNPTVFTKIVVAGGGMSGLLSAYHLKNEQPMLLEQEKIFGGNSKGENYEGSTYSIGAAYVTLPDEGSDIANFFTDLKLDSKFKTESDQETSIRFQNKLMKNFWQGASDPENAEQFIVVEKELRRIYEEAYPEVPWFEGSNLSFDEICQLDNLTFDQWLTKTFVIVHPHVREYFQSYCWSSFGGSIEELSAAQVLNFVAAEVDGVMTLPGGNSAITQALYNDLKTSLPSENILTGAFVLKISIQENGKVWVTYESKDLKLITIECEKLICAFPKFIANCVIENMSAEKSKAIQNIPYRGYLVTNVILNQKIESPGFDVFSLTGTFSEAPMAGLPPKNYLTDVCFGTWAQDDNVNYSVLTMYRPLPFDGARQFLFSPMAHQKHLIKSQDELAEFCKGTNIDINQVKGYRQTRWGHSLPLARKGMISDGTVKTISSPIENKIYFVNQDNWVNPAFECCFSESLTAAQEILS